MKKKRQFIASLMLSLAVIASVLPSTQVHATSMDSIGDSGSAATDVSFTLTGSSTNVVVSIPAEVTLEKQKMTLDDSELKPFLCNGISIADEDNWYYPYGFHNKAIAQDSITKSRRATVWNTETVNSITGTEEGEFIANVDTISITGDVAPGERVIVYPRDYFAFSLSAVGTSAPALVGRMEFVPTCKNVAMVGDYVDTPVFATNNVKVSEIDISTCWMDSGDSNVTVPIVFSLNGPHCVGYTPSFEGVTYKGNVTFYVDVVDLNE